MTRLGELQALIGKSVESVEYDGEYHAYVVMSDGSAVSITVEPVEQP